MNELEQSIEGTCNIFLVNIKCSKVDGYSLWGDVLPGGDNEYFLHDERKILIYKETKQLRHDIIHKHLLDNQNYVNSEKFGSYIKSVATVFDEIVSDPEFEDQQYNFIWTKERFSTFDEWGTAESSEVIDCLNKLYDAAVTLENEKMVSSLKSGASVMADFMDFITFATCDELDKTLNNHPREVLSKRYDEMLNWFEGNIKIIE